MRIRLFAIAIFLVGQGLLSAPTLGQAISERGLITSAPAGAVEDPWVLTHNIALTSRLPGPGGTREDQISADLYRPRTTERVPAAVIIHSSGGLNAYVEDYHARSLAQAGIASLVVDSYMPRGIRATTDDQSRLSQLSSDADAIAGYRWLASQSWVDPNRIIVVGMSRGGTTALDVATEQFRRRLQATDIRFAAHIAITTGGCHLQPRDATTTGAPIFFMLAELDDGTIVPPCLEFAERIRKAGNSNVRQAVYPGVYHAFELPFGITREANAVIAKKCAGRFFTDDSHHVYERDSNTLVSSQFVRENCIERGYSTGGDYRVSAQATADLLQFLRDSEILFDHQARAILPSCASLDGTLRRNCIRARNGWVGDLYAVGRAYRFGNGVARELALAARLLTLAADRGHPSAQRELAVMLQTGEGVTRNGAGALAMLRTAAQNGNAAAINLLGVWHRDGIELPKSDLEAVKSFQRASDLRDEYSYFNLGIMYRDGRGGLKADQAEALRLFRISAHLENPWGRLGLANALEKGSGASVDAGQARRLYEMVSKQDREPDAKRRAIEALARLDAAAPAPAQRTDSPSSQARRLALVIGNSKYESLGAIRNPRNDAEDVAKMLESVGFEVTLGLDLKRASMEETLIKFAKAVRDVDTALAYYAGHGVQHNGINYLAPIDASMNDATDLRRLINLQDVIDDLQNATRIRLLFIDACRDNQGVPQLLASLPKASRTAGGGRGLAQVSNAEGTLVVFATQPNRVAADGEGRNSPFTRALLKHLPTPNIEVRTLMTRVRADVVASTPDKQRPEMFDSLVGEFVFCADDCARRSNTKVDRK